MSLHNFSLTTFSPSGKLGQIEHALTAVGNGTATVGIKGLDNVVIVSEKKPGTSLIDLSSMSSIEMICGSIGMSYSGMGPDYRVLVARARKIAQQYVMEYKEDPPVNVLVKKLASVMQEFTQSGGVRPFGVSLLIAGIDEDDHGNARPCLYQLDPSGAYFPWKATAIGKNMASLKSFLEKRYGTNTEDLMILEDTIHTAILALKEGFEGQLDENSIEIGIIGADTVTKMVTPTGEVKTTKPQFKKLGKSEIRDYLANI